MVLLRLIEIAKENISSYQERFEEQPDDMKSKVRELETCLSLSMNMGIDALLDTLRNRWKNRFERCAESNGISLDEFGSLTLDQQINLLYADLSSHKRIFGVRRVDFSNRYEDGLRLNYMALDMGIRMNSSQYGEYCVIVNCLPTDTDVALKFDSLKHYYNDSNEFDENACHSDLLPFTKIGLLLSDKFSSQIASNNIENIKRIIEEDPDALEILTTSSIKGDIIETVTISYKEYKRISDFNKIRSREPEEEEIMSKFMRLQSELRRRGIKLMISKKIQEAV